MAKVAVSHPYAGVHMVALSAMIDGQVKEIRTAIDDAGYEQVVILGYSTKHASALFGPFREAAFSSPKFGDRRTYQMDYSNPQEAIREVALDIAEGDDMVMVKPALAYLDTIHRVKERFRMPTAYDVSGEYAVGPGCDSNSFLQSG